MRTRNWLWMIVAGAGGVSMLGAAAQPEKPATPPTQAPPTQAPAATPPRPEATPPVAPDAAPAVPVSAYVLGYKVPDIDGVERDLSQYKGKVVMIVNTASKCGYTWQYGTLEAMYQAHKDKGFVVLAFPSGDFKEQEFAENRDIKAFCTAEDSKYKVTFPLFAKMHVKGKDAHPLFRQLAMQPGANGGEPSWNFTKWLVNRKGEVIAKFDTRISPDNDQVKAAIEAALSEKQSDAK
ncbi:MAG: glutathione peroxidase [Planctomycetota bacterium]|nr:glutathione peroxidase [Planctomycetota bacterium]